MGQIAITNAGAVCVGFIGLGLVKVWKISLLLAIEVFSGNICVGCSGNLLDLRRITSFKLCLVAEKCRKKGEFLILTSIAIRFNQQEHSVIWKFLCTSSLFRW